MTEPTSPLQIADFRRFWLVRFCSVIATSGVIVIIGYQLYDVARQSYGMSIAQASFQLGLLGFAQFVPMLLLTPVAGVLADRFDRRYVGALAIAVDVVVALALALATAYQLLTLPLLFALGAAHGTARVFVGPAVGAIAPKIVPATILPKAIAINSIAWQAGTILGPAAAGLMYGSHASLPYWVAVGLLIVSIAALLSIRALPPLASNRDIHPVKQIADGLSYVRHNHFLLGCITLDLFAVLLAGATALLPVYARDILQVDGVFVGAAGLGQMRAAPALGAAIFALILSFRPLKSNVGVKMLWAVVVFGVATVIFGISTNYYLSLAMLVVLGAADMISVFVRSSLIQLNTPDAMRGRVSAISGLAISASNELGALLGAPGAVVLGGACAILITGIWAWRFPQIRRARTFAPQDSFTQ